ncbi:KRI1-like family C-terminal-domain-containing protein [Thamnocephalis sphaerospora]|uniref:KRI1-like family C-terminal-domain-containing protein n=1 Tax=Thamnocephalis sphaerospora TaxID=78915 RepID=A0A4V1IWZ4_9FUNG|nr:KRI1-like family C-terminal-domain-containing protein [Thamnocephalis sphaerospora]|eukprot:RKP09269.1 KRI1-like family C-terminal-domain-containing protein [Thamnocephalis sphaerospora]
MSSSDDETFSIKVNETYAKKYEERKRKEELGKRKYTRGDFKDKYGDVGGVDDEKLARLAERARKYGIRESEALLDDSDLESSSDEEDETGEMLTPEVDAQILRTITAIRSKDPRVYNKDTTFYSGKYRERLKAHQVENVALTWPHDTAVEDMLSRSEQLWKDMQAKKKEGKPVTLQDFQRKMLLEEGGIVDEQKEMEASTMTHAEEQRMLKDQLKSAVHDAFADSDNEEELFSKKEKSRQEKEAEDKEYSAFLLSALQDDEDDTKMLNALKSLRGDTSGKAEDAFLLDYILNRGWVDGSMGKADDAGAVNEEIDLLEDEQNVEATDLFESEYNFRFEEEGGAQLVHHARNVDGSMRRKDDSRKQERERRKERKESEKRQKMEELKRLKNLKKQEILEKLRRIQEITGNSGVGVDDVDLDDDFSPEDYDAKMSGLFDDNYYDESDKRKPVFEDDIDISDIVGPEQDDKKGKKKKKKKKKDKKEGAAADEEEFIMDADYIPGGEMFGADVSGAMLEEQDANDKKRKKKGDKKSISDYMDDYYQLDYEDIVGWLSHRVATRFKYSTVKPSAFGLSPVEILLADDADLNEHVSLKKLAPYRPAEVQARDERKYSKKKRLQEFRKKLDQRLKEQEREERKQQKRQDADRSKTDERAKKKRKKTKHA